MPECETALSLPSIEEKSVRFHFIDGLRGIAALAVLLYHIWVNAELRRPLAAWCPPGVDAFLVVCSRGVDIFFVLSGFVIAYSVRNLRISRASAGNFILRRQIRLDPPYWLWTGVTLLLIVFTSQRNSASVTVPTIGTFAANLFYVQGILGLPHLVRPSWTLCLEVQFYLVFIGLLWLIQRFRQERIAALLILLPLTLLSLVWSVRFASTPWFIGSWYLFGVGVIVYWTVAGRMHSGWLMVLIAASFGFWLYAPQKISVVGLCTALLIFGVERRDHLHDWLSAPVFRYFGAISYSLYLVHFDLVSIVARAGIRLTGDSPWGGLLWFLLDIGISVLIAHGLHHWVERPSMRFASRFKPNAQLEKTIK